jgi:alpha/beta superfamily hydrolase
MHGGTLHNKVVYRASQALARSGFETLRFNFRGVGLSEGRYDEGRGEAEDFRAAMAEAERSAGLPMAAGGFSFGAATALRAAAGDPRVETWIVAGLPIATESGAGVPLPEAPALFITGERDTFGPPREVERWLGGRHRLVVIPDTDHFFEGKLDAFGAIVEKFLSALSRASAPAEARP